MKKKYISLVSICCNIMILELCVFVDGSVFIQYFDPSLCFTSISAPLWKGKKISQSLLCSIWSLIILSSEKKIAFSEINQQFVEQVISLISLDSLLKRFFDDSRKRILMLFVLFFFFFFGHLMINLLVSFHYDKS